MIYPGSPPNLWTNFIEPKLFSRPQFDHAFINIKSSVKKWKKCDEKGSGVWNSPTEHWIRLNDNCEETKKLSSRLFKVKIWHILMLIQPIPSEDVGKRPTKSDATNAKVMSKLKTYVNTSKLYASTTKLFVNTE